MELKKLIYTVEDGIAVIQMNYLKNLNAIDEQMADELMYVVDAAEKDPAVKVVVLKGADRAFSMRRRYRLLLPAHSGRRRGQHGRPDRQGRRRC